MVKVVVALVGASDQSQQRPENRVTEGWGRRGSSLQPAEAAAVRPPSCSCRDGDSGPDHSLGSQDFSHYQLPPTLCSALPPPPPRTLIFAQLEISGRWRGGGRLNHSRVLTTPSWGLGPFRLHRNKSRRPSEGQGGGRRF